MAKKKKRPHAHSSSTSRRPKEQGHRDMKRLLSAASIVLGILLLSFLFTRLSLFHTLEPFSQNLEARLRSLPAESDVAIVKITDDDYRSLFQRKSPLDTFTLEYIISAIAEGKPKVIGVDLDTSDPQFRNFHIAEWWPPIVWQREIKSDPNVDVPTPLDVLGGKDPELNKNSGLAILIDDVEDKITRRYSRLINTTVGLQPTFSWALINQNPTSIRKSLSPSADPLEILYSSDPAGTRRFTATASRVLELYKGKGWRENSPIKDKIVLLGGSYAFQDQHDTPLGPMVGVEVFANVVESELAGGGYKTPRPLVLWLLEFVDGLIVVSLLYLYRFRPVTALFLGLGLAIPLSSVCSLVAYGTIVRVYRFAPTLLIVFAYQGFERLLHWRVEELFTPSGRGFSERTVKRLKKKFCHESADKR